MHVYIIHNKPDKKKKSVLLIIIREDNSQFILMIVTYVVDVSPVITKKVTFFQPQLNKVKAVTVITISIIILTSFEFSSLSHPSAYIGACIKT